MIYCICTDDGRDVEIQTQVKRFETFVMEKIDVSSNVTMSCLMKQHAAGGGKV
jgi:hypothetical protein